MIKRFIYVSLLCLGLTCMSVYAANTGTTTAIKSLRQVPLLSNETQYTDNTEQYKLTVKKDEHIGDVHVEVLPNDQGEYWIPKDYNVRITGDLEDGYKLTQSNMIYDMSSAKEIQLSSEPTGEPTLAERIAALEQAEENRKNERPIRKVSYYDASKPRTFSSGYTSLATFKLDKGTYLVNTYIYTGSTNADNWIYLNKNGSIIQAWSPNRVYGNTGHCMLYTTDIVTVDNNNTSFEYQWWCNQTITTYFYALYCDTYKVA